MPGFIDELKRRNVVRVGAAYLALAWVVIQVTETLVPVLGMPESVILIVFYIGLVGFPCVLLFAWIYELTPEGIKREAELAGDAPRSPQVAQRLTQGTVLLLILALAIVVLDQYEKNMNWSTKLIPRNNN